MLDWEVECFTKTLLMISSSYLLHMSVIILFEISLLAALFNTYSRVLFSRKGLGIFYVYSLEVFSRKGFAFASKFDSYSTELVLWKGLTTLFID